LGQRKENVYRERKMDTEERKWIQIKENGYRESEN
jgi:hypothetical protein